MTNYERLVEFLDNANETETEVFFGYSLNGGSLMFNATFVPDMMVMDDWLDIYDKNLGPALHAAVKVESEVLYDEDETEFVINLGSGSLTIAEK